MNSRAWLANNLAARLLAGPWTLEGITAGVEAVLGPANDQSRPLLIAGLADLAEGTWPPAPHRLTAYLTGSAYLREKRGLQVPTVLDPPRFAPLERFAGYPIPVLATPGELAAFLGVSPGQLDWLADERRGHARTGKPALHHYRYAFAARKAGPPRLIEAPKPRLKAIQRRILDDILSAIPVHRSAHGFVAGRSCLTGAQIHASEAVVATFDLAQFFPSIASPRVHGLFRSLGYPWAVARRLTGLCTTITPASLFRASGRADRTMRTLYGVPHLPQGSPASPALANLLAWRLDCRLSGLARAAGANYSRYADDLAFSGGAAFARAVGRFGKAVESIVQEEGFFLNAGKTRIMPASARQRVTGVVVNAHCNAGRAEFDRLKAILHHCVSRGPAEQNRAGVPDFRRHLDGRVAWVEQVNPQRGAKLRLLFERIDWSLIRA